MTAWIALANTCATGLLLLVIVLVYSRHGSSALVGAVTSLSVIGGLAGAMPFSYSPRKPRHGLASATGDRRPATDRSWVPGKH